MIFANIIVLLASFTFAEKCIRQPRVSTYPEVACPADKVEDASLCYTPCGEGWTGRGPVCWQGIKSYGRGVGTVKGLNCPAGTVLKGSACRTACPDGYFEDTRGTGLHAFTEPTQYLCTQRPDRFHCEL